MPKNKVKDGWFEFLEELMIDAVREFTVSLYPDELEPESITNPDKWRDDVMYLHTTCTRADFPKFINALRDKYPGKTIRYGYAGDRI